MDTTENLTTDSMDNSNNCYMNNQSCECDENCQCGENCKYNKSCERNQDNINEADETDMPYVRKVTPVFVKMAEDYGEGTDNQYWTEPDPSELHLYYRVLIPNQYVEAIKNNRLFIQNIDGDDCSFFGRG
jgi:hypothetical protein